MESYKSNLYNEDYLRNESKDNLLAGIILFSCRNSISTAICSEQPARDEEHNKQAQHWISYSFFRVPSSGKC